MRSKIEANEYKDYILGFIFYKYVSDKLVQFARREEFSNDDIHVKRTAMRVAALLLAKRARGSLGLAGQIGAIPATTGDRYQQTLTRQRLKALLN